MDFLETETFGTGKDIRDQSMDTLTDTEVP